MKNIDEILEQLKLLIEDTTFGKVKANDISGDSKLISELGLDSLDYATIMLGCERWLKTKVDEKTTNWQEVQTVLQLAKVLFSSQK